MQSCILSIIQRKNQFSNRSGTLDRRMNIFGHWINESGRYMHKVQLDSLVLLEIIQSRAQKTLSRVHALGWQKVLNSLFMSILWMLDTFCKEIQLQMIYFWAQLVIKLDNDGKKDTTAKDWNAVNKVGYLPSIMTTLEIFFHITWITL